MIFETVEWGKAAIRWSIIPHNWGAIYVASDDNVGWPAAKRGHYLDWLGPPASDLTSGSPGERPCPSAPDPPLIYRISCAGSMQPSQSLIPRAIAGMGSGQAERMLHSADA